MVERKNTEKYKALKNRRRRLNLLRTDADAAHPGELSVLLPPSPPAKCGPIVKFLPLVTSQKRRI